MWHFVSPNIVFGEDALHSLEELTGKRALIVTDNNLVQIGIADRVTSYLKKAGFEIQIFDEVEPDPTTQTVIKGAAAACEFKPDWIVGLGGGSPLDAAKALWVLYERPDLQPAEINPFIKLGLREKSRLITIPTTSGTGAEVTWGIVLTDAENQRKMGLGNRENAADIALVDPAMAAGMPPHLTADTGIDALTHAVEGFICTWHTDITNGLCLNAARDILQYLPLAYEASQSENPDQDHYKKAREKMHNAATSAGLGFGNAMASMAHAMGHTLGSIFHLPHGRSVGLFLPYTIEFTALHAPQRIEELAAALGIHSQKGKAGQALATCIREISRGVGLPGKIADAGVEEGEFNSRLDKLVDDAFNDTQMITAARTPSFQELEQLYRVAYHGQPVDF
jgi:alcohol dehydrogenase class IV